MNYQDIKNLFITQGINIEYKDNKLYNYKYELFIKNETIYIFFIKLIQKIELKYKDFEYFLINYFSIIDDLLNNMNYKYYDNIEFKLYNYSLSIYINDYLILDIINNEYIEIEFYKFKILKNKINEYIKFVFNNLDFENVGYAYILTHEKILNMSPNTFQVLEYYDYYDKLKSNQTIIKTSCILNKSNYKIYLCYCLNKTNNRRIYVSLDKYNFDLINDDIYKYNYHYNTNQIISFVNTNFISYLDLMFLNNHVYIKKSPSTFKKKIKKIKKYFKINI